MLCRDAMFARTGLICLMFVGYSYVTSLSLCETDDGFLEIEKKEDNRFTCRNIPPTSNINWTLCNNTTPLNCSIDTSIGMCSPPAASQESNCQHVPGILSISRHSVTTSVLTLDARTLTSPSEYAASLRLGCMTKTDNASCMMDFIYRPTDATCRAQFTTSSVSGQCTVSEMYSQRSRYRCRVYERKEGVQFKTLVANTTMATTSIGYDAFSGTCTFQSYLPPDGRYNYAVVVVPGEVEFPFVFTGSNEIRTPSTRPIYDCPNSVQEGQHIQCACSVSDYGAPPAILQWDNTGSTQLSLTNVTRGDTGRQFVCRLTWNNTDVWTLNYTLIVTYPSMIVDFNINFGYVEVTVIENLPLTLTCTAKGRPSPRMSLIGPKTQILPTVPIGDVTTADLIRELTYNFSNVHYADAGNYSCDVDNGIGAESRSIMVVVVSDNDSSTFTSGLGVGVGVTVGVFTILIVAGVVWMWRRKWVLPCRHPEESTRGRSLERISSYSTHQRKNTSGYRKHSSESYKRPSPADVKRSQDDYLYPENDSPPDSSASKPATEPPTNQRQQMHRQGLGPCDIWPSSRTLPKPSGILEDAGSRSRSARPSDRDPEESTRGRSVHYDQRKNTAYYRNEPSDNDECDSAAYGELNEYGGLTPQNPSPPDSSDSRSATQPPTNQRQQMHRQGLGPCDDQPYSRPVPTPSEILEDAGSRSRSARPSDRANISVGRGSSVVQNAANDAVDVTRMEQDTEVETDLTQTKTLNTNLTNL